MQRWMINPDDPGRDLKYNIPFGTRRIIEQQYQRDDYFNQGDHLSKTPGVLPERTYTAPDSGARYGWFPRVLDGTYQNFPNTRYDYSEVDPRDRPSYFENFDKPKYPIIKSLP